MRTKKLLIAGLAVALSATGVACGGSDDDTATDGAATSGVTCPVDALKKADGPVELVLWHILASLGKKTLDAQVEAFNASQDKVKVVAESQGTGFEEIQRKVEQAMPDRTLPGMVFLEDTKTQWVHDSGVIIPAQACLDADPEAAKDFADLLPIARTSYSIDDQLWPASFGVYTAATFYNRAHFAEVGLDPDQPPRTLEEIYEYAKVIKAKKPDIKFPVVIQAQPWIFEWWLSGAGQPLVNNGNGRDGLATKSEFDNPRTVETLELLQKMKREGLLDVVPGNPGQVDHLLAMAQQQSSITIDSTLAITTVAGVIEGTIDAARLKEDLGVDLPAGVESLKLDLDLDAAPLAGLDAAGKGQMGGGVWYITNTTPPEVQAAAWEFAKFLNRPENQAQWTIQGSNVPVFERVIKDPAITTDWATTLGGGWQKTAFGVLSGVDADFPGPVIGPYTETRAAVRKALEKVLLDDEEIGPAVAEADATITKELKTYAADVGG